ncbi:MULTISPECIES: TldD/PmbA family protein [Kosmotoga]|uniref:Peptidase U62 modulator of DNA gyrase n=1 Tax=Kosmotoga olearia (strain ATCC BAA-1733 / DSM 21960 / TBF 19.5.1) TaxID=521045 RepID=C5CEM7_KOSOT|nr:MULTISPECIES: TldD/PmbA family protein [Kosmotoga]ACR79273.1 peptidase U62 modulator of DNA gyrase [Kosmotoga olearia TBF 19.5.1]MDI3524461.1 TldD protein [Kosmotoga sp.]MDK2953771.1 TldD protein [Kosmotoga sp.]OAA23158.1 peptidase C69 [Kosmotoga sp. DU53]
MIDGRTANEVIGVLLKHGAEFVELFIEERDTSNFSLVNGQLERALSGKTFGIGIRAFSKNRSLYAFTNDLSKETLVQIAANLGEVINGNGEPLSLDFREQSIENRHLFILEPSSVSKTDKVKVMKMAFNGAKSVSKLITQVLVDYWDYDQRITIINSEGLKVSDRRLRTRLMITAVASRYNEKETGFYGPGAAMGFEFFNTFDVFEAGQKAGRIAARMVEAEYAPAGRMPVIIANEFGGVIFHEACGHALEATSVAKGSSVFTGKLGQKIAADCVSAVDDATIPNAWGSTNIDDEGTPTRRNVLIENGVLKSYLIDRFNGIKMGMESTGSARRQDYRYAPTSRMSNTFILPGPYYPEEIISNTEYGLYAKSLGGGSVNTGTGEFNFAVREGYLIEKGRITKPVRGATLIGKGSEILMKIDMVGNDLKRGQGMCGSASGLIPAEVGQPTIRVSELTVGGRNR